MRLPEIEEKASAEASDRNNRARRTRPPRAAVFWPGSYLATPSSATEREMNEFTKDKGKNWKQKSWFSCKGKKLQESNK